MDAKQVDAIEIKAAPDGRRVRIEARVPPEADLIDTFLKMFEVQDLDVITAGVRAKRGFGTDYAHASYGKSGVTLTVSNDSELMPVEAFERLIARLLRASSDAAKKGGADATRQPWWSKAEEDAKAIISRAYPAGLTGA